MVLTLSVQQQGERGGEKPNFFVSDVVKLLFWGLSVFFSEQIKTGFSFVFILTIPENLEGKEEPLIQQAEPLFYEVQWVAE